MKTKWDLNKEEHLKLSALAADKYDDLYEKQNFATGSYMQYEIDTIKKIIGQVPSKSMAIDIGCGAGRDSFVLSRHFQQVYGYDMSSAMVTAANKNKILKRAGNVSFQVLDIEERELPFSKDSVPFINTAFGMGSFVQDVEKFFKEVKRVLLPGGVAITSFYNTTKKVYLKDDKQPIIF